MAITAERLKVDVEGDTSKAQKALGDLEAEGSKVPNWVGAAKGALAGLFGIGAAAGASFTAGLLGNISAADANAKVSAQLLLTQEESARVGDVAGSLFADAYGESIDEVNTAVGSVVSSVDGMRSASAAVLEDATADVLNFASAYEVDVDRAAQVAGQAVRQGLAPDFQTAMDLMTAASSQVPAAIREDLLDAVDEYGGYFTSLGLSGEEAFTMLVDASEDGMYGIDKTGDAIKEFTVMAADGFSTAEDAFKGVGLNAGDMANDVLAGGDTARGAMDEIITGLLSMSDPAEQAAAAVAVFGAPIEDLNATEIPDFLSSLQNVSGGLGDTAGAADRMGDTLNSGPGTALTLFKRRAQDAFMGITDWALPPLMNLAGVLADEIGPAVQSAADWVTGTLIPGLQDMATWVEANKTPILAVAGVITAVFLPGLVAMGVAATVAKVKVVASWVAQRAAAVASVAAQWGAMARTIAGWAASAAAAVASGAQTVAIWAMYQAAAIRGAAASVAAHARVAAGWVAARVQAVASGAVMVAQMAATAARTVAGWVLMGTQSMLQAARMAAAWVLAMGPVGWITAAVIALVALIIANWETVKTWTISAWNAVSGAVSAAWTAIQEFVMAGVNAVKEFVQSGLAAIRARWNAVWNGIKAIASSVWGAITGVVQGAIQGVRAVIVSVLNAIRSTWSSIWNGVRSVASSIWNGIKSVISGAISNVLSVVNRVRQVIATIRNAFTSAKTAAQSVLTGLVSYVRNIPSRLVGIFTGAVGTFANAGRSIINGLKDGVMGAFGSVRDAVSNGLSTLRNLLPFSPAKEGPFSGKGWTLYSGRSISEALAQGIRDRMGHAKRAALGLARATSKAAEVTVDDPTFGGPGDTPRGPGGPHGGPGSPGDLGAGNGGQGGPTFIFNTYNPVAEAESVTMNKTLQRAAGLGW